MKNFTLNENRLENGMIPETVFWDAIVLDLSSTTPDFPPSKEIIAHLIDLQNEGLKIFWPNHFGRNDDITSTKQRLNQAINSHREATQEPEAGSNLVAMIGQYLDVFTKDLDDQQTKDITGQVHSLLLDAIEENPSCINWLDSVGKEYLQACENRTAFGFIEMASCLSIAQKESTIDKSNAAKIILIMDRVAGFFNKYDVSSESGEIESGILLLVGVADRLDRDGVKIQWSGIPPYLSQINEDYSLKEGLLDLFYQKDVREEISKSPAKVSEYLCNTRLNFWSAICFPEQVLEIEKEYAGKIDLVKKLILGESCDEEEKKTIKEWMPKTQDGKRVLSENPLEFWSNKLIDLSVEKNVEISQMVMSETRGGCPKAVCGLIKKASKSLVDLSRAVCENGDNLDNEKIASSGGRC